MIEASCKLQGAFFMHIFRGDDYDLMKNKGCYPMDTLLLVLI
nr:MAG TPA: hypothetical protein [Caudoviricetes sp.]